VCAFFFFFNDTATTEIYTLSLHDALPISSRRTGFCVDGRPRGLWQCAQLPRSEEHTSELQSRRDLVCRLLLEKNKKAEGTLGLGGQRMTKLVGDIWCECR